MNRAKLILILLILISLFIIIYYFMQCNKMVRLAKQELNYWNGRKETDPSVHSRLTEYWREGAGWDWVKESNITNYDNEYAWSAAGISYVARKVYPIFPQAASHSKYTLWAKLRREAGEKKIIAFKPDEYKPKPGDIVLKTRASFTGNLDTLYQGATTHGDIVTEVGDTYVKAIGFNLSNTVKEVTMQAQNGRITDPKHFAVIKM